MIPMAVFQNLVRDNTIDSANKLEQELIAFLSGEYEILHSYPAGVITRDYVIPVLNLINQKVESSKPYPISFPCKIECNYNNSEHNQLIGYVFSANKEYYAAKRIHSYFMNSKNSVTFLLDKYYSFLRSSTNNVGKSLGTEHQRNDRLLSKIGHYSSFTFNHAIPILDYLNELAEKEDFRYSMKVYGGTLKSSSSGKDKESNLGLEPEVIYHIKKEKIYTDAKNIDTLQAPLDKYISIKKDHFIECYKMSKWAYMIHVYLIHLFQKSGKICLEEKTSNETNEYFIEEFDAHEVWTFWYNSPKKSNSYYAEFSKAVEELSNIYFFIIGLKPSEIKNIFILPNTRHTDRNYNILKKYNETYEMPDESGQEKKIFTIYDNLYHIYKPDTNDTSNHRSGKYYVYIKKQYANYFIEKENLSIYPKAFANISPKTSYSQIHFYELLYDYLPYDTACNTTKKILISKLAFKTGKIDIADWKVNMYFKYINPAKNSCITMMYKQVVRNNCFMYDLIRSFIQPAIKKLNVELKNSGEDMGYKVSFNENTKGKSQLPYMQFCLAPIDDALNHIITVEN